MERFFYDALTRSACKVVLYERDEILSEHELTAGNVALLIAICSCTPATLLVAQDAKGVVVKSLKIVASSQSTIPGEETNALAAALARHVEMSRSIITTRDRTIETALRAVGLAFAEQTSLMKAMSAELQASRDENHRLREIVSPENVNKADNEVRLVELTQKGELYDKLLLAAPMLLDKLLPAKKVRKARAKKGEKKD